MAVSTIPQLAEWKRRLHELEMGKARYGYSVDPHVSMEATDLANVIQQADLIEINRGNLQHLLKQADSYGLNTPPHVYNQINTCRANIAKSVNYCNSRGYNIAVIPGIDNEAPNVAEVAEPIDPAVPVTSMRDRAIADKLNKIDQLVKELRILLGAK